MASRLLIRICLAALISLLTMRFTNGFTPAANTNRLPSGQQKDSSSPTSQTPPITAQKMLKTIGSEQERGARWKLSNSILASCDTLPSFPTAHGLLSPETVSRMDENTKDSHRNEAVAQFLEKYRRNGPMSCLSMLSDPEVLPHLTEAMRDIV